MNTNAEMCTECEMDGAVLPSIESFQMRLKLPKVYYLFYEFFFKAVVGEGLFKRRFVEGKRFGTNILEAFAHLILVNNYFAWLYDYYYKNPGTTLKTEYDLPVQGQANGREGTAANENDDDRLFCGDLDEVEIALPHDGVKEYQLVTNEVATQEAYKAAQEASEMVRKEALANISPNSSNNRRDGHVHVQSYGKVKSLLRSDTSFSSPVENRAAAKEMTKKKRKCMRELKIYTGSGAKKSRRDSDKFKGWSEEGKMFMVKMTKAIKDDVESGVHGEWEKMYRKISAAVYTSDDPEEESESAEVDYSVLMCEV